MLLCCGLTGGWKGPKGNNIDESKNFMARLARWLENLQIKTSSCFDFSTVFLLNWHWMFPLRSRSRKKEETNESRVRGRRVWLDSLEIITQFRTTTKRNKNSSLRHRHLNPSDEFWVSCENLKNCVMWWDSVEVLDGGDWIAQNPWEARTRTRNRNEM